MRRHAARLRRRRSRVCADSYLAQSTKTLHFGLGGATAIDAVEVRWPDGTVEDLGHPPVDALHVVMQPVR